jgi:hypothetical protein
VHIGSGVVTEGGKKLFDQFQLEVAYLGFRQGHIEDQEGTPREIKDNRCQRFMHRHGASAVSTDPSLVTERFFESFTETDTNILNRVVGIYLQVAFCVELQIEKTVASDLGQHMIEERHSRFNLVLPATIQPES